MSNTEKQYDANCQLQVLPDACDPPGISDRLRYLALRVLVALEKRLGRSGYVVQRAGRGAPVEVSAAQLRPETDSGTIAEGDRVVVRSVEEIRSTLDGNGRCRGLSFMPDMERYCGGSFLVRKRVRAIFDERAWRMLKIKNTVLLDDCICEGRGMYGQEGCDRCCYYFWKEDWLKKEER